MEAANRIKELGLDLKTFADLILTRLTAAEDQDPGEHRPEPTPSWSIERAGSGTWHILRHMVQKSHTVGKVQFHRCREVFDVQVKTDPKYITSWINVNHEARWEDLEIELMLSVVIGFLQDLDFPKRMRADENPPERVIRDLLSRMIGAQVEFDGRRTEVSRDRWVREMDALAAAITGVHGAFDGLISQWREKTARVTSHGEWYEKLVDELDTGIANPRSFGEVLADHLEEKGVEFGEGTPKPAGQEPVTLGELAS